MSTPSVTITQTKPSKMIVAVFLLVVLLLIVSGFLLLYLLRQDDLAVQEDYSAVFISNSQVYFGRVGSQSDRFITLHDVYYFRAQQLAADTNSSAPAAGVTLVKLGDELHGPQSSMDINRDHILFIEKLRPDSQVMASIRNAQK